MQKFHHHFFINQKYFWKLILESIIRIIKTCTLSYFNCPKHILQITSVMIHLNHLDYQHYYPILDFLSFDNDAACYFLIVSMSLSCTVSISDTSLPFLSKYIIFIYLFSLFFYYTQFFPYIHNFFLPSSFSVSFFLFCSHIFPINFCHFP